MCYLYSYNINLIMIFKASLDRFNKISTILISVFFAGVILISFYNGLHEINYKIPILGLFFTLIYTICLLVRPLSYAISDNKVIINRLLSNVSVNFSDIKEVKNIKNLSAFSFIRVFAVGGLFGHYGKFWTRKDGFVTFYATKNDGAIMLITNTNKKIIITPDDTDVFLECFLKLDPEQSKQ